MRRKLNHAYDDIISIENLLESWKEFKNGKRNKEDVALFERNLMDNLFSLHHELKNKTYRHAGYEAFKINDPKPRDIHKALVRDRLVHHAIYRQLYWFFDRKFIHDSYSCRKYKGTHRALDQFRTYIRKMGKNNTKQCWVLKSDIKKFFASIDHVVLKNIIATHVSDAETLALFENIIDSFSIGLPLGNLTSQLLVNVYMNEFDQFVKHKLKQRYYIRYADDFVFLNQDKKELESLLPNMRSFLSKTLKLQLHPNKVFIKTISSGVDFLGWVHFPNHRVLRSATRRRMQRKLQNYIPKEKQDNVVESYLGMLSHGNAHKLQNAILHS